MKIARNTPDQLILENTPWFTAIALILGCGVFVAIGIAALPTEPFVGILFPLVGVSVGAILLVAFVRRTQLILDRPRDLVELRRRSFRGYTNRTWALSELDHAIIQTSRDSDGPDTHRAAMVMSHGMDAGTHPITLVYASGRGASRAAGAINDWLDTDPPTT